MAPCGTPCCIILLVDSLPLVKTYLRNQMIFLKHSDGNKYDVTTHTKQEWVHFWLKPFEVSYDIMLFMLHDCYNNRVIKFTLKAVSSHLFFPPLLSSPLSSFPLLSSLFITIKVSVVKHSY